MLLLIDYLSAHQFSFLANFSVFLDDKSQTFEGLCYIFWGSSEFLCHLLSSSSCIINQTVIFMKYLCITPSLLFEHNFHSLPFQLFSLNTSQFTQTWHSLMLLKCLFHCITEHFHNNVCLGWCDFLASIPH